MSSTSDWCQLELMCILHAMCTAENIVASSWVCCKCAWLFNHQTSILNPSAKPLMSSNPSASTSEPQWIYLGGKYFGGRTLHLLGVLLIDIKL